MPYQSDDNTRPLHTPLVRRELGDARHAASYDSSAGQESGYPAHAASTSRPSAYVPTESAYGARANRTGSYADDRQRHSERVRAAHKARRLRTLRTVGMGALIVVLLGAGIFAVFGNHKPTTPSNPAGPEVVEDPVEPELSESELRIEEVRARASVNCTREQPSGLTDPADYATLGRDIMEGIVANAASWDEFENVGSLTLDARTNWDGEVMPYLVAVNRAANVVTVYALDSDGRYTVPYMSMACSTGTYTPLGYFVTDEKYSWLPLYQQVFGQYATRIVRDILFHSVPFYNPYKDDLEYAEFNKLGTAASLGCVRMQVCDVKWVYDNCPIGTPVLIYDDADNPGPMGRPGTIATSETDTDTTSSTYRGFDPTDPDSSNPWDPAFRSGTAIRSAEAQAEWDAAQADGRWSDTINPTDLLGYSTDAESRE